MKKYNTTLYLKSKWDLITQETEESNFVFNEIIESYSQKHRFYHTIYHLEYMFKQFEHINYFNRNVFFATFFHDFIYRIGYKHNEEHSAFIIRSRIEKLGVSLDDIIIIEDYVKKTKHHNGTEDNDLNIFLDCDMSILGSDKFSFDQYCINVRKEYLTIDYQKFYKMRFYFLNDLLNKDKIFFSKEFNHLESKSRKNIKNEIDIISSFF